MKGKQSRLVRNGVFLLVICLLCPQIAKGDDGFITSETNLTTLDTPVVISAPYVVVTHSTYVFTTGIPIQPVCIQAPSGLNVWLTLQCRGGATRVTVPDYVANYSLVQVDPTGEWTAPQIPYNATTTLTGLGIKFQQNISVTNDALSTLTYGKGADNDIAGKATMTITLNWNVSFPGFNGTEVFDFERSRSIYIWAPTALTSVSTYQGTVSAVCLVGIFAICCLGCLNTNAIQSCRRYNVLVAKETQAEQECEQTRVFNPLWMPCAPSQPGYYNIESTPNPLMFLQRRLELKNRILTMPTPHSLQGRLTRVNHLRRSRSRWFRLPRPPCAPIPKLSESSSSSDDEDPGKPKGRSKGYAFVPSSYQAVISRSPAALQAAASYLQDHAQPAVSYLQNLAQQTTHYVQESVQPIVAEFRNLNQPVTNYLQQRAQPVAGYLKDKIQPAATYLQELAQPAVTYVQERVLPAANSYLQHIGPPASNYTRGRYRETQSEEAEGNVRAPGTITVGFAFIHPTPKQDVFMDPTSRTGWDNCQEYFKGRDKPTRGNQEGDKALLDHSKGKKPMSLDPSLELYKPVYLDEILQTVFPQTSLETLCNLESHYHGPVEEDVSVSLEDGSLRSDGGAFELTSFHGSGRSRNEVVAYEDSELYQAALPCAESSLYLFAREGHSVNEEFPAADNESQDSGRTSDSYRTPLSDIYEEIPETLSAGNINLGCSDRSESPE